MRWTFPNGQVITQLWNATFTQTGANVSATNLNWNASIAPNATVNVGFNANHSGTNNKPTSFTLSCMHSPSISHFEHIIATLMQHAQIPGLAIALVEGQNLLYTQVFGSSRTTRIPLMPTSLFQAASLSKPVFAYGVLKLWERGDLDLDTPLAQFYADPAVSDPQATTITARQVLSHTTGLPNWREEVNQTTLIPAMTPGAHFSYSGEGFEYLQRAIEYLTAQPLATYLQTTVLAPLGMTHSRFEWGITNAGEELLDADGIAAATGDRTIASAAWSLVTTAADYAHLLLAMLNPGEHHTAALRATSIAAMLTPQVMVGNRPKLWWGLGWGLQQTERGISFWHWGGPQNSYTSYTATLLEQGTGVVILTNSAAGLPVCKSIAELVLEVAQPAFVWLLPEDHWEPTG